jgi:hypothetical protein
MARDNNFPSKRARTIAGIAVVSFSLLIAVSLAGIGFAQAASSSAEYQYGKITICHKTGSKTHPWVTITISKNAWPAHQRHGDKLGPCPPATPNPAKGKGHGKDNGHKTTTTTTTTTATPTTTTPTQGPGNSGDHGKGGDNGNGNGGGNGQGNGGDHGNAGGNGGDKGKGKGK